MARALRLLILLGLVCFSLLAPALANDTLVTLGMGGLVPAKTTEVSMESENLRISRHEVIVKYVFRNTTDHDVDAVVAFPLPALDGAILENEPLDLPSRKSTNFVSFKVWADGKAVSNSVELRAFKNGKDITERLKSLGLPVSLLDPGMKAAITRLPASQRKLLEDQEIIAADYASPRGTSKTEKYWWPWWEMHVQYYWTQHFPAHGTIRVVHTYKPVVGGSYLPFGYDATSSIQPFCGGPDALGQIKAVEGRLPKKDINGIALYERQIQYVLTTANNWKGPIAKFHLEVVSDKPEDIVLTCMPDLRRTSPTRFELSRTNFSPDHDLNLLILQANE